MRSKPNNTKRIFRFDIFNSFTDRSINDINWTINTGESVIVNSEFSTDLTAQGSSIIYLYHNYSDIGEYNLTITVFNDKFVESETLEVNV